MILDPKNQLVLIVVRYLFVAGFDYFHLVPKPPYEKRKDNQFVPYTLLILRHVSEVMLVEVVVVLVEGNDTMEQLVS